MKNKYCKEDLEKLISEEKLSYEAIGKMYGVSGNAIRKAAKRLGIELPKRRAINESETFNKGISKRKDKVFCKNCGKDITHKYGNIYCDVHCQTEFQRREEKSMNIFSLSLKNFRELIIIHPNGLDLLF